MSLFEQSLPPTDYDYLPSHEICARTKKTRKRKGSEKGKGSVEEGVEEENVEEEGEERESVKENRVRMEGRQDLGVVKVIGKGKKENTAMRMVENG